MTHDLWNAIKRIVEGLMASMPQPRRATVESIDTATMRAKVTFQPEGALSGWLPIFVQALGNGWGLVAVPDIGAQVMVVPIDGYAGASIVVGGHWSNAQQPPQGYNVGELWLYHKTGAYAKFLNTGAFVFVDKTGATVQTDATGKLTLKDASGTNLVFNNDGSTATFTGVLRVTGDIVADYGTSNTGFLEHYHTQGDDSAGDTEQNTSVPVPGT